MEEQIANKEIPVKSFVRVKAHSNDFEIEENTIKIYNVSNSHSVFYFDKVFGPHSTTENIFAELEHAFELPLEHNITILAYGQTGSGKTYTMKGTEESPGLVQQILQKLLLKQQVQISFIEIYNEKILDLCDSTEKNLRESNGIVFLQDLTTKTIQDIEEFSRINDVIIKNRKTAETNLNKCSSRSHLIVRIEVDGKVINLVDLAGSENNRKTGNQGNRMIESSSINKSLFVLNKVVNAIVNKEPRIPYRDSKLTRLLQESIGGSGLCYIIATVIDQIDENGEALNTLSFASKSKKIVNHKAVKPHERIMHSVFDRLHANKKVEDLKKMELDKSKRNEELVVNRHIRRIQVSKKSQEAEKGFIGVTDNHKFEAQAELEAKKILNQNKILPEYESIQNEEVKIFESRKARKSKKSIRFDSSSSFRGLISAQNIEMTPITKKKSTECFAAKAREFESVNDYKSALETYKTLFKFAPSEALAEKIKALQKINKKAIQKFSCAKILGILNSGSFIDIKKLSGIGDKRAQMIVDFISGGNFFECLDDLKLLFNEKVVKNILESADVS